MYVQNQTSSFTRTHPLMRLRSFKLRTVQVKAIASKLEQSKTKLAPVSARKPVVAKSSLRMICLPKEEAVSNLLKMS